MRHAHFAACGLLAAGLSLADSAPVWAGMPSITLTDVASVRLQSISFFLVAFLLASLVTRTLWNSLRSEFPRLPFLSYPKALGLVGLWGLLFLLVLTMISGARELMTPGAWKKDGLTYTLTENKKPEFAVAPAEPSEEHRREKLRALFAAMQDYAVHHDGRYPPPGDPTIRESLWKTPHASGMRYVYFPGHTTHESDTILACEPEVFAHGRLSISTTGEVRRMKTDEVKTQPIPESMP